MNNTAFKTMLGITVTLLLTQAVSTAAMADPQTGPASAQGAEDTLSVVIVTARRIEERLQDVPISISVFTQAQLSARNIVNSSDLAEFTPSLSTNTNFGSQNTTFAIRGFVQDIGTQPSVGVYFADVVSPRGASNNLPIGDGAGPGTFWDLQNVQVLKGPQGTLFGRNTTGGAILVVPQKPTAKQEGYAEVSYGNYGMRRVQAVENLPINESVRLRVGADWQQRDGYLNNSTGIGDARLDNIDYYALRASLVVDITPNLENYTIASNSISDTTGGIQKMVACNPTSPLLDPANFLGPSACAQIAQYKNSGFYTVQNTFTDPDTRQTMWQVINTTTWHIGDTLTLKNIASYAQLDERYRNGIFGTDLYIPLPPTYQPVPIGFTNSTPIPGGSTADESTATEELQLQGQTANNLLTWVTGGYVEDVEPLGGNSGSASPTLLTCSNSDAYECTNPIGQGKIGVTEGTTYFTNVGLFEQAAYSVTDQLKLTEGLRYTWDRNHTNSYLIDYPVPTPGVAGAPFCSFSYLTPPACNEYLREASSAPTWLLGIDYKPTDDMLLYAKYVRGYRAGGISPQAPAPENTFQAEKVDTYETGFKTSFQSVVSGTFDADVFYNNFKDQQLQVGLNPNYAAGYFSTTPASAIFNAGKSRIWGAEMEATLELFKGFVWDTSYTYLDARVTQVTAPALDPLGPYVADAPVHAGDTLTLTPRSKVSTTVTYTLPLSDHIGRVAVSANYTYSSAQLVNYVDREAADPAAAAWSVLPSLGLVNLNLTWKSIMSSRFDVSLFATNVGNRDYYTFAAGLYNAIGFETAVLGEPRMYGARIRYSW